MKLPWRRERAENPWNEEVGLSGWFPGQAGPALDLFACMATLCRWQWELAEDHLRLLRLLTWQSRIYAVAWFVIFFSSMASLATARGWW